MIIDIHTHIFPPKVIAERDEIASIDPSFAMIYSNPRSRMITAEQMIENMDKDNIQMSIVCNYPWEHHNFCIICNDYILESVNKYPKRLKGFICIQPSAGKEAVKELERCFIAGASGVGEMGYYRTGITKHHLKALIPITEILKEYNKPFMLHTNEPVGHKYPGKSEMTLAQLYEFVKIFQDIPVILAHWGGGFFFYSLMPEIAKLSENIYYDTAASPFLYDNRIYKFAIDLIGNNKILFGSDAPLLGIKKYIAGMKEAGLSQDDIKMLLGENAKKLLKLNT